MAYKVIKAFTDGQDNRHIYSEGDVYPRPGATPSKERIEGLLGTDNKQGVPLIEEYPKKVKAPIEEPKEEPIAEPEGPKAKPKKKTKKG